MGKEDEQNQDKNIIRVLRLAVATRRKRRQAEKNKIKEETDSTTDGKPDKSVSQANE